MIETEEIDIWRAAEQMRKLYGPDVDNAYQLWGILFPDLEWMPPDVGFVEGTNGDFAPNHLKLGIEPGTFLTGWSYENYHSNFFLRRHFSDLPV